MRFLVASMAWLATVVLVSGASEIAQAEGAQVKIPLEQLARDAELIVKGIVERITVSGQLHFVTINMEQVIKGTPPPTGNRISIRTSALPISGNPVYQEREELILFLQQVQGINALLYETIGGIQGKYEIRNGYVPLAQMTVEEFIRRIRQAP